MGVNIMDGNLDGRNMGGFFSSFFFSFGERFGFDRANDEDSTGK